MIRVTLKGLLAHKARLVTTTLAVMLGVAFTAGTLILTDTVGKTFDDLFADVNAGTDAVVRRAETVETEFGDDQRGAISADLVDTVSTVDGVAEVEGQVGGYAQFVDAEDEPIGNPGQGAPTFGFNWSTVEELNPFELVEGRPPEGPGEVVADKRTADGADFEVGDTVVVLTQQGPQQMELVGIAKFGDIDSPGGASVAMFETEVAQQLVGQPGQFSELAVVGDEGLSQTELAARIAGVLPAGTEAITGDDATQEDQDAIAEGLSFFSTFLLVFAFIALFVGCFIIYNTFSIIIAQRTRELALLRALGASRRQLIGSVLLEAVIVGLVAGGVGLAFGVLLAAGLKALLAGFGIDIPSGPTVVAGRTIVVALVAGVFVTTLSAVFPAWRASRIAPLAVLRDVEVDTSGASRVRLLAGALITVSGVAFLFRGLFTESGNALANIGLGAVAVFLGVAVLGPVLARPASRFLGAPLPRLRGMTGTLARENAVRNPKRTAATASALMIGVGIVTLFTIFADSAKASIAQTIDDAFVGDFVIDSQTFGFGGLPPQVAAELNELSEVKAASGVRLGFAEINGESNTVFGVDAQRMFDIVDVGISEGSIADLDQDGLAIQTDVAEDNGWQVGDVVPVFFSDTGSQSLTVVLLYTDDDLAGDFFVGLPAFEANFSDQFDFQVYVTVADGVDPDDARVAIEGVTDDFPNAEVLDLSEFKDAQASQINQLLGLIFAMLALAIVIALLGIANTLSLSVLERTRELGLLRAVGMTRRQLRSTIRWESVIIALFGALLGLSIGLFFAWAIVQALADEGLNQLSVPIAQLAVIVAVAGLAGVLAAVLPAWRASRLDVLDAIAYE